jgi:Domain of unknown function (DUF4307)
MNPSQNPSQNPSDPQVTAFLRERYGNSQKKKRLGGWKFPAFSLALIGGAWLIWSGSHASNPEFRTTLISFTSTSENSIELRYSIQIKHPIGNHQCTLIARDADKNTVGEIVDHIPLGQASITRVVTIPTRLQAVNAAISSCTSL